MRNVLLVVLWCLATSAAPAWAERIHVVTEEDAPNNYTDESGQITGLATEIVREILTRAKLAHQIEVLPWARAYKVAQEKANVAIYSIGRTAEREGLFKWVGVIVDWEVFMYKMKDRVDVRASKLEDLKSYVLGGVRDDARTLFLHAEGFAVDQVTSDITNLRKLQLGRIDAFASDDYAIKELAKQSGIDPDSVEKLLRIDALSNGLNLAFSLKTPEATVERCRAALAQMKRDGTFKRITARWRSKP